MQELVAYLTEHNKLVTDLEHDIDQYREIDKQNLKRIAELEAKHQWQPIETAPKNLTEILGYRCDAGVFVMVYGSPEDMMTDLEIDQILKEEPDADWLDIEDWFCYMQDGSIRLAGDEAPTHWMPLPEPPENQHE